MEYYRKFDVHNVALTVSDKEPESFNSNQCAFKVYYEFYNNLPYNVNIGTRDGVKYSLTSMSNPSLPQLLTIRKVTVLDSSRCSIIGLPDVTTHALNEVTYRSFNNMHIQRSQFSAQEIGTVNQDHLVSSDYLQSVKTLYADNLDLIISIEAPNLWEHPYSPTGITRRRITESEGINHDDRFALHLKLVGDFGHQVYKFINIGGNVFRIPIIRDPTLQDGIYYTYNCLDDGSRTSIGPKDLFYTWGEESKLPYKLYNSWNEAIHYGNEQLREEEERKRELLQLQQDIAAQKLKLEEMKIAKEKAEAERDELRSERKFADEQVNSVITRRERMKEEAHKELQRELEWERARTKHKYEMENIDRKDKSEWIKYGLTIAGGLISILAVVVKSALSK